MSEFYTDQSKPCKVCGKTFYRRFGYGLDDWAKAKYCSHKCLGASKRIRADKPCAQCGGIIQRPANISTEYWNERKYCSRKCVADSTRKPGKRRPTKVKESEVIAAITAWNETKNPERLLTTDDQLRICEMYVAGIGTERIAAKTFRHLSTVQHVILINEAKITSMIREGKP